MTAAVLRLCLFCSVRTGYVSVLLHKNHHAAYLAKQMLLPHAEACSSATLLCKLLTQVAAHGSVTSVYILRRNLQGSKPHACMLYVLVAAGRSRICILSAVAGLHHTAFESNPYVVRGNLQEGSSSHAASTHIGSPPLQATGGNDHPFGILPNLQGPLPGCAGVLQPGICVQRLQVLVELLLQSVAQQHCTTALALHESCQPQWH